MHRTSTAITLSLFSVLICSRPVRAQLVFYTDKATFEQQCPGLPVEDFSEARVVPGGAGGEFGPLDKFTGPRDGVFSFFRPGDIVDGLRIDSRPHHPFGEFHEGGGGPGLAVTGPGWNAIPGVQVYAAYWPDTLDVMFYDGGVAAAGMGVVGDGGVGPVDLRVFGPGDVYLGMTTVVTARTSATFLGVSSPNAPITRINLAAPANADPSAVFEGVAYVEFGGRPQGVPEPGTLALTIGVLVPMAWWLVRRRSHCLVHCCGQAARP